MGHGGRPKAELVLSTEERLVLERLANRRKSAQAMAIRARIVINCAKGDTNRDVAAHLGVNFPAPSYPLLFLPVIYFGPGDPVMLQATLHLIGPDGERLTISVPCSVRPAPDDSAWHAVGVRWDRWPEGTSAVVEVRARLDQD